MQVSAEALGPKSACELLVAGADEVLMPTIGAIEETIDKAVKVAGPVTVHAPANRIVNPESTLGQLREAGVENVLMVSGNPGHGRGTRTLYELIRLFRERGMHVSVGAYPENYFRRTGRHHRAKSVSILRDKQQAGAQRIMTQASFSVGNMGQWLVDLRSAGVTLPVHVGVMARVPRRALLAVMRTARAEFFSHPGMPVAGKANLDMIFRLLWSHVPNPEQFIARVGGLDGMGRDDGFHVFAYGADVSHLIAAGHAVNRPRA